MKDDSNSLVDGKDLHHNPTLNSGHAYDYRNQVHRTLIPSAQREVPNVHLFSFQPNVAKGE